MADTHRMENKVNITGKHRTAINTEGSATAKWRATAEWKANTKWGQSMNDGLKKNGRQPQNGGKNKEWRNSEKKTQNCGHDPGMVSNH